jgi:two-component system OmpR family sensor kinase
MATSLQATLQRRFCCTMFVALALIGVWAYLGVRRTLHRQLDRNLRSASETVADGLAAHMAIPEHPRETDRRRFVTHFNRLILVRDRDGRILQTNSPLARGLPLDTVSFRAGLAQGPSWTTGSWEGEPVRVIYAAAPPGAPADAAVIQIAASLLPLEGDLRAVLLLMATTVGLGSLATLIGSGWLARSALSPVGEIAAQARAISGGQRDQRITVHAHVLEFQHLIEVLNEMVGRLERAYDWHRRIVRDLGHDLRTPITALRAGVEVALWNDRRPDEYRRVLGSAMEEIERLTLISDALVLLGRLESGDLALERAPVDLAAIAADAVARVQQRIGAHVFRFTRPTEPASVLGDARLLGLAFDQLIDNARRHTPAGTVVELSVASRDGRAVATIEDNGPGVPDELLPHLFERFFRTAEARGRESGPGLGLTLVAAILQMHQGVARAERSAKGGLRVQFELPSRAEPSPVS